MIRVRYIVFLLVSITASQSLISAQLNIGKIEKVDSLINEYYLNNKFNGAVLIAIGDSV